MGRRGVASSGGPRVVGARGVDFRAGDRPRLEQAGALGCQDDRRRDAAAGESSVEVVLPEGRSGRQRSCSGWSWVAGVDAVGGPPHGYFTNYADVRLAAPMPTQAGLGLGERELGSDSRGRRSARRAWQDTGPKRDDHEALPEYREAKKAALGRWLRGLGGASRARRPCPAVFSWRPAAAVCSWRSGCSPVSAAKVSRGARRVGQDGPLVSSGTCCRLRRRASERSGVERAARPPHGARRCSAERPRTAGQPGR